MTSITIVDDDIPNPGFNPINFLCIHVSRMGAGCYVAQTAVVTEACTERSIRAIADSGLKEIHIDAGFPDFRPEWVTRMHHLLTNLDSEAHAYLYTTNKDFKAQLAEKLMAE